MRADKARQPSARPDKKTKQGHDAKDSTTQYNTRRDNRVQGEERNTKINTIRVLSIRIEKARHDKKWYCRGEILGGQDGGGKRRRHRGSAETHAFTICVFALSRFAIVRRWSGGGYRRAREEAFSRLREDEFSRNFLEISGAVHGSGQNSRVWSGRVTRLDPSGRGKL